jgi:type IX secretion system PorP/SprF family membrane protein
MRRFLLILSLLILSLEGSVTAQDPQFSQFYAAPLYLNPALAGSTGQARAGINYRNQWPSIDANFTTMSAFFDYYIADYRSAIGALITRDVEGLAGLQSISLALQYSYQLQLSRTLGFRPGFQAALYNRNVDFGKLTFGDQFDQNGELYTSESVEQLGLSGANRFFVDLSAGGVFFTEKAWLGVAASHLNRPNQSISNDGTSRLPIKYSVHGGFKFFLKPGVIKGNGFARKSERSIAPALQYRHQGQFDQLDLGLYFTAEPIVLGSWYRGVPYKSVNGFSNNESIVLLIGFTQIGAKDAINIGYSYDITISKLGSQSGGAHEFSLVYTWPMRNPRKPPPDKMVIPCPFPVF